MFISFLRKNTTIIFILLFIVLLIVLLFSPASSSPFSIALITFGIGTAITFTVHGNWEEHKQGDLTQRASFRNTILDLLGLAITMGAAIWLGKLAGSYIRQSVENNMWGMIVGITTALVVGFVAGWFVQRLWGILTNRWRVASPS